MKRAIPFFKAGDVGGMAYSIAGNIVNYVIVIATLKGVLNWPDYLIYGRVIPGMSIGLMGTGIYYAWMAHKLARKEGRSDVTALPSGISTPAMFVFLYGIIMPLNAILQDPEKVWAAAVSACFLAGGIEMCGAFVGPAIRRMIPRAALLGTVAGIALVWMANKGLYDTYADPLPGMPVLIIALIGLIGGYVFPKKIPPLVVALVGGIILAIGMGRAIPNFSGFGFQFMSPVTGVQSVISGFTSILPYLGIIIPVAIYVFVETMDNVESAVAAGDVFDLREAQIADGCFTMLSALCGSVLPITVWLGHAGLKKEKAGAGYSWISGLILGACGIFGAFVFINSVMPPVVAAITFLWCAIIMVSQAFKEAIPLKHAAAVVMAMIPHLADYGYTQVTGALGAVPGLENFSNSSMQYYTSVSARAVNEYGPQVSTALINNGVMWAGVPELKAGAIITGMIWATATAFIIDKRLDKAAVACLVAAAFAFFGFIHQASLGLYWHSPFVYGYLIMAAVCYIMHLLRKYIKSPEDFEYV